MAAKTQVHSSCRARAASSHIDFNKCVQLQAERPSAAWSWQQERGRRFSVEGCAAAGALPDQHSSQMPLAQEFRGWMRHASWTYCSRQESMVINCQRAFCFSLLIDVSSAAQVRAANGKANLLLALALQRGSRRLLSMLSHM